MLQIQRSLIDSIYSAAGTKISLLQFDMARTAFDNELTPENPSAQGCNIQMRRLRNQAAVCPISLGHQSQCSHAACLFVHYRSDHSIAL